MAQVKDEAKRVAIRNAAVAEVVKAGVGGASIAAIAKRAGVSAGTIYLYYPNKDQMLQQIYLEIKTAFHARITAEIDPAGAPRDTIRRMWFAMYDAVAAAPADFLFSETIATAQILNAKTAAKVAAMAAEIVDVLARARADGALKSVPLEAIRTLLVAPAMQLARQTAASRKPVDRRTLNATYELIWSAVSRIDN